MKRVENFKTAGTFDDLMRIEVEEHENSGRAYANYDWYLKSDEWRKVGSLRFQKGLLASTAPPNGVTESLLLSILVDRLKRFQANEKTSCRENALALTKIEEAAHWMQTKSREQIEKEFIGLKGIEG